MTECLATICVTAAVVFMEPASALDASAPTTDSSIVCSGLRNRMEAAGSTSSEPSTVGASAASVCKEDVLDAPPASAVPADEQPDLTGERGCFALLIVLYALQGSLLGLASGTLPFIIQVRLTQPARDVCVREACAGA